MIESFGERMSRILIHIFFVLISLFCVVPFMYVVSASFTSQLGLMQNGYTLFPSEFSTEAYRYCMQSLQSLLQAYGVTIVVTVVGTVLSLVFTSMLAYVVSRRDFPLHRQIAFIVFFTMLFNGGMVPSYILITKYYHLRDTLWVMILPYVISAWNVFLMKGFFANIPTSLLEASKLDGCTEYGTFFRIVVPVSKPAFATVGLLTAFGYWNDWWLSMMYTTESELTSLQYYLQRIMKNIQYLQEAVSRGMNVSVDMSTFPTSTARMALCVLAAGPMLIIFPFFQKYFVKGLTVGSVKE